MNMPSQNLIVIFAMSCLALGCFREADGVFCVNHSDCLSNTCDNGICMSTPGSGDGTDTSDTGKSVAVYSEIMNAVDILFVVDNSGSMAQEQEILSSSIFSLMNQLHRDVLGTSNNGEKSLDVRVAVTNSDMGVAYDGGVVDDDFPPAPSCAGAGNDGKMLNQYMFPLDGEVSVPVKTEVIECAEIGGLCPPDWICTWIDENGNGVCTPRFAQTTTDCPKIGAFLTENVFLSMGQSTSEDYGFPHFVASAACLAKLGVAGCAFEAPLAAIPAAFSNYGQQVFLRKNAMTVIIVVTDEDDCSKASEEWFNVSELGTPETNIACGKHSDLLMDINNIKNRIVQAKTAATGVDAEGSILFAAIAGVPIVNACQGAGSELSECLDVALPKGGTVGKPVIVERLDPNESLAKYYEFACERYDDETNGMVTQAYPATRVIQLAQLFGDLGYVYSICNDDWTSAMTDIGRIISSRLSL